jgi:hypothetical protein
VNNTESLETLILLLSNKSHKEELLKYPTEMKLIKNKILEMKDEDKYTLIIKEYILNNILND